MSAAAKVGLFMIVILAILGYFIIRVEDIRVGGGATRNVEVVFDSVAGLDEKSAVRVAGVRVGKVADIQLLPDGRAKVTLEVEEGVQLRSGATAKVASLGLLGEKYVEIEPGPPGQPPLTGEVQIAGASSASIDQLTDQVSKIAEDVKAITASLRAALGGPEGTQRMEEIVANVHDVTVRLRSILATNEANISATAENFRAITDDLRVEIPRIAASIDRVANSLGNTVGENREDVRAVVQNLRGLSTDLKSTVENLNSITGQIKTGEGTVGKLIYDDEAHEKLTSALGSIDAGVGDLRGVLGRINKVGLEVGVDGYYLSDTGDAPFEGNSRINIGANIIPNTDRNMFLMVGATQDARGEKDEKYVERTTIVDGVESTTITRETRWDKDFLVSAQVGWEYDDLRIRAGLIDSYGGVGADWQARPRIHLTGEIYNFGEGTDDLPHFRLLGRWQVRSERPDAPAIYFNTGVENILNEPALMIGAGVRWRDEDLKYLLGSMPIP